MSGLVAVAFLLRHDHGLYIGVASAIALALASWSQGWRTTMLRIGLLTGAVAACLLPWMLFVVVNGGLFAYFDRAVEYARAEANASNLRTWPTLGLVGGQPLFALARPERPLVQVEWRAGTPTALRGEIEQRHGLEYVRDGETTRFYYAHDTSEDNLRALADDENVAGTTGLGRVRRPFWREWLASASPLRLMPALHSAANAEAWLFWLFWSLPVLSATIAVARRLRKREGAGIELAGIAALAALAVFVNAGFLRDALRTRLADAIVPAVLLGAWLLSLCWRGRWRRRGWQQAWRVATVALLIVSGAAIEVIAELPERINLSGVEETAPQASERGRPRCGDCSAARIARHLRRRAGIPKRCCRSLPTSAAAARPRSESS